MTGGEADVRPPNKSTGINITNPPHIISPKIENPSISPDFNNLSPLQQIEELERVMMKDKETLTVGRVHPLSIGNSEASEKGGKEPESKYAKKQKSVKKDKAGVVQKPAILKEKKAGGGKRIGASKNIEVNEGGKAPEPQKNTTSISFALSSKQQEALHHPAKFLLYGGAKGGGKSWFMCVWIFLMAMKYRGNKLFFCRRRSVDFTNTTLETWKKSIPANMYRINEQKKKIYIIPSGSVIDYGGLDDPLVVQSLNSAEFAHIGIDQAEEIEMDSFAMLRGTLRHRLPDGTYPPYQIRLTANPAQCWLKDYFILRPESDTAYIPALPTDNPGLPKDYVENLRQAFKHRPHLLEAYLHGSWDDLSGNDTCIRGTWIEEAKKKKVSGQVIKRVVVNDPAITGDENVCFLMEKSGNVYYKADELIIEHKRPFETAALLASYRKRKQAQIIALDVIGIGQGVVDGLNQLEEPVLAINSCAKPTSQNLQVKYSNLRAQMWWEAAEKFADSNVALPPDDFELARQLGVVKFDPTGTGKLLVQDKAEIKKAIGRSPDRADAFVMGLYALDYVSRLDHAEYTEAVRDRAGYGILVNPREHEDQYVGVGEDYSGYNL